MADKQFSNKSIAIKLEEGNYLRWRQCVELIIIGHGLEAYIDGTSPPQEFITASDGSIVRNPALTEWRQVDASLASWLLSSISSPSILSNLSACRTARSIWLGVQPSTSTTRTMRLLSTLNSQKKGDLHMRDYLSKIQELCDMLASADHKVTEAMHISAILNGLGPEFESTIAVITGNIQQPFSLAGAITVLLDAELRIQDSMQQYGAYNVGIRHGVNGSDGSRQTYPESNPQHRSSQYPNPQPVNNYNSQQNPSSFAQPPRNQVGSQGQGQAVAYGRGRGYAGRPQCQLCGRFGHLVNRCWFRFDPNYSGVGSRGFSSGNAGYGSGSYGNGAYSGNNGGSYGAYSGNNGSPGAVNQNNNGGRAAQAHSTEFVSYSSSGNEFMPYSHTAGYTYSSNAGASSSSSAPTHYTDVQPPCNPPSAPLPSSQEARPLPAHVPRTFHQIISPTTQPHLYAADSASSVQNYHASSDSALGASSSTWYPDSGATNHLTNSVTNMTQSSSYKGKGPCDEGGASGGN